MGTLEKQRALIERKIAVVNLLKSVVKFSDDRLRDPKDHVGVAKEVQDMVTFALEGMVARIEGGGASDKTNEVQDTTLTASTAAANNAKVPTSKIAEKRQKSAFAKRYAHLADKEFILNTKTGEAKAKVVGLDEPNIVVQLIGTKNILRVPVELVNLSGGQ